MKKITLIYLFLLLFVRGYTQPSLKKTTSEWIRFDNYVNYSAKSNPDYKSLMGLCEKDGFQVLRSKKDRFNRIHTRWQQTFEGIPIHGAVMISHEENGIIQLVNGHFIRGLSLNTIPSITKDTAQSLAIQYIGADTYAWESKEMEQMLKRVKDDPNASFFPKGTLLIYSPAFDAATAKLAYEFEIYALNPDRRVKLFIDAHTGEVLGELELIHKCTDPCDVSGTGQTEYNGMQNITCRHNPHNEKYFLMEEEAKYIETRDRSSQPLSSLVPYLPWDPNYYFTNPIGQLYENDSSDWGSQDPAALSVHWASEQWYDYFSNYHDWDSYDGENSKILNVVHYGQQMNNAFWNGDWSNYGDGNGSNGSWTSVDITAHEISHGLIQSTANLIYQGESGALNESFADIFAIMVERYALGENNCNWTIGEDITGDNEGIRDMSEFMEYEGTDWFFGQNHSAGLHENSGVQNYWFYLLSDEIGIDSAAAICFHSLLYYLTPYSTYEDAKNASIQAALELYDQNTANIVCNKWIVVGVGNHCGNAGTITINPSLYGDTLIIDNSTNITWTITGNIELVDIEYAIGSDTNWQTIVNQFPADSNYIWNIPNLNTNATIFLKISNTSNHGINDMITPLYVQECPAIAAFSGDTYTCLGGVLDFAVCIDSISISQDYGWYLNGTFIGTGEDISWTSNIIGQSEIELRAYDLNSGCFTSFIKEVFIADSTEMSASFSYQKVDSSFYFTVDNANPYVSYEWDLGDGIIENELSFIHTYTSDNIYTVCLMVENDCGTFESCENLIVLSNEGSAELCDNEWTQYTNGGTVRAVLEVDSYIWVGTVGGLVKLSKLDGSIVFFNSANSPLPNNWVRSLLEDTNGNIWIGTWGGGLIKNNGTNWEVFNNSNSGLPNNTVHSLLEDMGGNIWIGTWEGLVKYDGISWEVFNSSNSGLPNNIIRSLLEDTNGNIWVGTRGGGLAKHNGISWEVFNSSNSGLPSNYIHSLLKDVEGNIWVGTRGGGLAKYNGTSWEVFNSSNSGLPSDYIHSLLKDAEGNIWVGVEEEGLVKYNSTTWELFNISNSSLPNNNVLSLLEDTSGAIWVGTVKGLVKYNGVNWEVFNNLNSDLPDNYYIYSLLEDTDGNIWVGTYGGGLAKYDGTNWEIFNISNSNSNYVLSLLEDESGNIWVGTGGGVVKYDGTNWEVFSSSNSALPDNYAFSLLEDADGNIWIGTDGGLARYDGTSWEVFNNFNSALPDNYVYSLLEDRSGNIWIGTRGGLAKYNGSVWEVFDNSNSGLPNNSVLSLLEDMKSNIWIGTSTGLAKYNGSVWEVFNSSNSGLPGHTIRSLLEDMNGNIWGGTCDNIPGEISGGIGIWHPSLSFQTTISCAQDSTIFINQSHASTYTEWVVNNQTVSYEEDLGYIFPKSGDYEIILAASNTSGCTDIYRETITIPASATELSDHLPEYISICESIPATIDSKLQTYATYTWIFENDTLPDTTLAITADETGTYYLSVVDSCGASAIDSVIVITGVDCVWSGDCDKNGTVTNRDLLLLGLVHGSTGSPRQGATIEWIMQAAATWITTIGGGIINAKHVDTNGDGEISNMDKEAILENYGNSHTEETNLIEPSPANAPYTLIPVLKSVNPNSHEIEISLEIQSEEGSGIPFYGLAAKLAYESTSVFDTLYRPLILEADIIGEGAISLIKQFEEHTEIAFVGTNHLNYTLQNNAASTGEIRHRLVSYNIGTEQELPGGDSTRYLSIMPREILMINNVGDTIPVKGGGLDIYLVDDNFDFVVSTTPVSCDSIGTATIHPSDSSKSYSYLWSTGETNRMLLTPSIGIYGITVTDDETGNIAWEGVVNIEGMKSMELTVLNEGEMLTAHASGGDGNYLYFWNEGEESTPSIPWSGNTDYSLTVVDGNGCIASISLTTLPIELLSFTGYGYEGSSELKWDTASEEESSHFVIEHSNDGLSFDEIGQVKSTGNTLEKQFYEFTHENPDTGINYYRLRMVDLDGTEDFSKIISINFNSELSQEFSIFPNPNTGKDLFIGYDAANESKLNVEISDVNGQVMLIQEQNITEGINQFRIDVSTLSKGIYFIRLEKDGISDSQRFTIIN